jgi:hypothetical protein
MCGTNNAFPYFVAVDSLTGSSPFFMPKKANPWRLLRQCGVCLLDIPLVLSALRKLALPRIRLRLCFFEFTGVCVTII